MKRIVAKTVTAGFLASLILGWAPHGASAAPVITNMPHRADGTQITGSQPVPRTMPADVAVKAKPQDPGTAAAPSVNKTVAPKAEAPKPVTPAPQAKPATPAPQPATPKTETPKPVTPPAQPKPAVQQTAPKAETPKPATPAVQPATPKTETPKPVTPAPQAKPATPPPQPATPKAETPKPVTPAPQAKPAEQTVPKAEAPKPATPTIIKPTVQTAPKPAVKAEPAKLPTKPPGLETKKPEQKKPAVPEKKNKKEKPEPEKSVYQVGDKGWKIKQAQQYLVKLGFDPGEADGRFTKSTRRALRKFQKKYNLKETGNLDNATYEELKWQTEAKEYGGNVASTKILKTAAQYKGVPYVFGGTTPRGFDCSGYVQYVFAKHGIRLTRTADTQAREGKFVSKKNLKPGDLVFFTTYEPGASHVGIYAGNNLFWNATSSRGIMLSNLTDSYWGPRYYTARRILTGNDRSR